MAFKTDPTAWNPREDARMEAEAAAAQAHEQLEQLASVFLDQVNALTASHPAFREAGFYNFSFNAQGTIIHEQTTKQDALESVVDAVRDFLWEREDA